MQFSHLEEIFELRATNFVMLDGAVQMELVGMEVTSKTAVMTVTEGKGGTSPGGHHDLPLWVRCKLFQALQIH